MPCMCKICAVQTSDAIRLGGKKFVMRHFRIDMNMSVDRIKICVYIHKSYQYRWIVHDRYAKVVG